MTAPRPPGSPHPDTLRLEPLLGNLVNYERTRPRQRQWSLDTIRALLARPGAGSIPRRAVQVAGSKGKGTTCLLMEALARGAGMTVGTYLSPHVETVRERVRLDGDLVSVDALEDALAAVIGHARSEGLPATFFEAMTAAAVDLFAAAGVDLSILEVGLGGRWDATTAVEVDASIVTSIELEHTELLGDTVAAIAGEKAHVIRPGGVSLTAAGDEALTVLQRRADEVGARLLVMGSDFGIEERSWRGGDLVGRLRLPDGRLEGFRLPDARAFEVPALILAAGTLTLMFPDARLPLAPVPRPWAPGRFEVLAEADGEPLVLDGAHTPTSLAAVASELRRRWPRRTAAVLYACAAGKRWREGLSELLDLADRFLVTDLTGTAGEDPASICAWLEQRGAPCLRVADPSQGLRELRRHAGPRLVTGSFYLVGRVRMELVGSIGTDT